MKGHVQEASCAIYTHLERAFALQDAYQLNSAVKHKQSWGLFLLSGKQDIFLTFWIHLLRTQGRHNRSQRFSVHKQYLRSAEEATVQQL